MATKELNENHYIDRRCPICSSLLLSDGEYVWCSLLDGDETVACEFGHDEDIPLDQLTRFTLKLVE